jgi:hypothetical protein
VAQNEHTKAGREQRGHAPFGPSHYAPQRRICCFQCKTSDLRQNTSVDSLLSLSVWGGTIRYGKAILLCAYCRHENLKHLVRSEFAQARSQESMNCTFSSGETPNWRNRSDFSAESGTPNLASIRGTDTA